MKIVKSKNVKSVKFTGGTSKRIITESDKMGFGLCETHVPVGGPHHWHYKNHLESCYCVSGKGILTNIETKEVYDIFPGITYILDKNDNHTFEAITETILISVFNPPLKGTEKHDENGNYSI